MKISLLLIVFIFNCYVEAIRFYHERPREILSKSQGSSDLNVSVWLPNKQWYSYKDPEILWLICNTYRVDGEIWCAKDEANLTDPLEAKNGSEVSTIWKILLDNKKDAGNFTCVAKTTEMILLKRTVHVGKIEQARIVSPVRIHDVPVNESVTLACDVIGYPIPLLYWDKRYIKFGRKDIMERTYINETYVKMSMNFKSVQHADEGSYYCVSGYYDGFNPFTGKGFESEVDISGKTKYLTIALIYGHYGINAD